MFITFYRSDEALARLSALDWRSPGLHSRPHIAPAPRPCPLKDAKRGMGRRTAGPVMLMGWCDLRWTSMTSRITSTIAPLEMTLFLNLSSYWILSIGDQVLSSTVKTTMTRATNNTENTKAPTTEGELLRKIFHQLRLCENYHCNNNKQSTNHKTSNS